MSTILVRPYAYTSQNTSKFIFCGMLHQTLRISSTTNVTNSPVTKRHRSQQRYVSLGWLNNGRKRNRVYNTLRPYRILQKIPPNSFSVSVASNASYIIGGKGYKLARDEATPLTTALRAVGMVKQRQKTQSCLQYFEPIAYISQIPPNSFSVGFESNASYIIDNKGYKLARDEATPLTTALRVVGMVKQRQKTQSCLQYFEPIAYISENIIQTHFLWVCCIKRFVYHRRQRLQTRP